MRSKYSVLTAIATMLTLAATHQTASSAQVGTRLAESAVRVNGRTVDTARVVRVRNGDQIEIGLVLYSFQPHVRNSRRPLAGETIWAQVLRNREIVPLSLRPTNLEGRARITYRVTDADFVRADGTRRSSVGLIFRAVYSGDSSHPPSNDQVRRVDAYSR